MAEPTTDVRTRIERELAQVREQRRRLAAELGGEDPADADLGDRGDAAVQLEGLDDLARLDRRITELERQLAEPPGSSGLPDGTVVTLRYPDGDVATLRIVTIPDDRDDTATADSPLGRALVGRRAGDPVTWSGPDGELRAEVVALDAP